MFENLRWLLTSGFIMFLCRKSVRFSSWALSVFLMKESKKKRRKQPDKLTAKSRSQPVNLPCVRPLMNPLLNPIYRGCLSKFHSTKKFGHAVFE